MAQKQNNASKNDISSRSFDEILERMRSRVSEISEGGDVEKALLNEQSDSNSAEMNTKVVLTEEEQDRAFLKMAKKQSTAKPKKALEASLTENSDAQEVLDDKSGMIERRADQTSVMDATIEDQFELDTYQQILSALEMKDFSKVTENTDHIDEIVAHKAAESEDVTLPVTQSTPSAVVDTGSAKQPYEDSFVKPAVEEVSMPAAEETVKSKMETEGTLSSSAFDRLAMVASSLEKSLDGKKFAETKKETIKSSVVVESEVKMESKADDTDLPKEDEIASVAAEDVKVESETDDVAQSEEAEIVSMVGEDIEAETDDMALPKEVEIVSMAGEDLKVEVESETDDVALSKDTEPVTGESADADVMKQEISAARSVSADVPAVVGKDALFQQNSVEAGKATSSSVEVADLSIEAANVLTDNAGEGDKNARLDRIEETLKLLMTTQVQNEDKASEMLKKQEESFLKMTAEAQKVAEATATKVALQSSSEVALEAVKKHSAPQDDVMSLKEEFKLMNARLADNIEKQKDAYELMQIALEALNEKISVVQEETQKPGTTAVFVNPSEEILRQQQFGVKGSEARSRDEAPLEPVIEEKVAPPIEEEEIKEVVAVKEAVMPEPELPKQPVSAQVLRAFVNAPLIGGNFNSDAEGVAIGQQDMAQKNGEELPMPAPRQAASDEHHNGQEGTLGGSRTTDFSGHTYQQRFESLLKDKKKTSKAKKSSANSSVMLAISSMLMFSVSGYLFYNQLKTQNADLGAPEVTASVSEPAPQSVAQNSQQGSGLVGEKKLVQWSYSGAGKSNIARLSSSDKVLKSDGTQAYSALTSATEIIEVSSADQGAPTVTGSLGNHSAVSFSHDKGSDEKLRNGKFTKPALSIGSSSLRQAAGKGVASAMFEVARRYQNGKGVKKDYKSAAKWYRRAANKGYAPAQYRLGTLYERGRGVTQNIQQARDWYRLAAKTGNVKAMHNLGVIFSGQKQIKADYALATKWFTKAAQYGLADSQFNLAIINYNGLGKKRDLEEAYKWFALAAKNGDKAAKEQKDNLAQKMKIRQLMDSRRKVSSWKMLVPAKSANIDLGKKYFWRDYAEM